MTIVVRPPYWRRSLLTILGVSHWLLPATAQDMPRVRQTISTLSSPAFHGRGYVKKGEKIAAQYLQQRFQELGLQALTPGYQQPFTLPINAFPHRVSLKVNGRQLRPGLDYIAEPTSGAGAFRGSVYHLDSLIFSRPEAQATLLRTKLSNTALVVHQRDVTRLTKLSEALQQHLATAVAQIVLIPNKLTASLAGTQASLPQLQVLARQWPTDAHKVDLQLDALFEDNYPTQNILGYLPGQIQPDSFLVVTAHYDHLGRLGKSTYFPGANDNASGTAMMLELAAYYSRPENRPAYSLLFIAFGAEEAGLVGSKYFVDHPLIPLEQIRFLLNLDLLGTGEEGLTVVNGRVFEHHYQQLVALNKAGNYLPSLVARGRAANSDHYYFSERGVPAFFVYTRGGTTAYHDVADRANKLPLTAFRGVFLLLRDFLNTQGAQSF